MSSKLSFGYLYDFRNPPPWRRDSESLYAAILDVIVETERLGFGGAWVPEHHLADDGYLPAPLLTLAAIAARTERLRIGTAVALAPLYHPLRFAEDCAVLDILSRGRLDLGLGIGYRRRETAAMGVDFTRRGARFDEFLEIVSRLWAGETVNFAGRHFQLDGAKLMPAVPRGHVPLYIGGFSDKAIERATRYGQGYIGTAEGAATYVDKLRQSGAHPDAVPDAAKVRVIALTTVVAHDPEAALAELAPYFHYVNNSYGAWFHEDKALGTEGMSPMTLEEYRASGDLRILTPEAAITMLREMREQMPVEHFMMMMPPGLPAQRFLDYAGVFAREVMPAFA